MKVAEFRAAIAANPDCSLRVELADGAAIADHFHVTEVSAVTKDFVDCGGVRRTEVRCGLQTLVAGDIDHRLTTTKLAKILALVEQLDLPEDAVVEVEHQERSVSIDVVDSVVRRGETVVIRLRPKQTACLAEDACGIGGLPQLTTLGCGDRPGCC
ncbi:hypothetical protein Pla108_34190 [Botrimarina colliarenosi]|uniref:Uncharacterized protein n=1 Tax=Botrimarina colliarenosi TaxID=2528001 RepID=A0A5C6A7I2_9BACT|nr:DUF6428 family protein [Botrimarina colliarenosi]TWT95275.1 hypothetical protein Pla108_34190 [Botrimarina colliarenosi]